MLATETRGRMTGVRVLGKIPIRNLWLLLLYASDLYRYFGTKKVEVEDNPDQIANLVAEVLCHQVEERLKRNLSYGYIHNIEVINRVRGRIDLLTTERHLLLEKAKVCCGFDELTIDTARNQYVRAALECLAKLDITTTLAHKCGNLAHSLERLGVGNNKPVGYHGRFERFGRHDIGDKKMLAAADLAFSLALPTEMIGRNHLPTPSSELEWLRELFEKAIAGFYAVALNKREWRVSAGEWLGWNQTEESDGINSILPKMKTDIAIYQRSSGTRLGARLVIDTKFTAVTSAGRYRDETLASRYIYQMYSYLRSQENSTEKESRSSMGMLLHPTVDRELAETAVFQGHPIWFATVNLGESSQNIRQRLLDLHKMCFEPNRLTQMAN